MRMSIPELARTFRSIPKVKVNLCLATKPCFLLSYEENERASLEAHLSVSLSKATTKYHSYVCVYRLYACTQSKQRYKIDLDLSKYNLICEFLGLCRTRSGFSSLFFATSAILTRRLIKSMITCRHMKRYHWIRRYTCVLGKKCTTSPSPAPHSLPTWLIRRNSRWTTYRRIP